MGDFQRPPASGHVEGHALARELALQKFHLIGEYAAVRQRQIFGPVRHIGDSQQRHPGLLRPAAALFGIAMPAGRDHIRPLVAAALRQRDNMIAGQQRLAEPVAAVHAEIGVPEEQLAVGQRRDGAPGIFMARRALDGDDGMHGDARTPPGHPTDAAIKSEVMLARGPGDHVTAV